MGKVDYNYRRKSTETIPNSMPSSFSLLPLGYCRAIVKTNTTESIISPWESQQADTTAISCKSEIPKDIGIAEALVRSTFMTTAKNVAAAFVLDWAVAYHHNEPTRPVSADAIAMLTMVKLHKINVSPSLIRKRNQLKQSALIPTSGAVLLWLESSK